MVGPDLNPNSDWWVSVIFKKLVSDKVLKLNASDNFGTLRLYAHCTVESASGAVTVYGVNLSNKSENLLLIGYDHYGGEKALLYILTADTLKSRFGYLFYC